MRLQLILFICLMAGFITASATTHHVGPGQRYPLLTPAVAVTKPGDTILLHKGNYPGGLAFINLQGKANHRIHILASPGEQVIFTGGANAIQLTDAAYLLLKGIIFQHQTGNGFNIDDGGSYNTPSHHITFDSCIFRNINAQGNNDLLKLSGLDSFVIKNCSFLNGAAGGSGIDMVGCHDGLISNNRFENLGSNSLQIKGGSKNIKITYNHFKNGGQRTINLGGSTGLPFFRPANARYEAASLQVYSNIFIGSDAPIAFVGCIDTEVSHNTFYLPQKWVIRILQETVDTTRFYPCGNNSFHNNIIYRNNKVGTDCNVGAHTNAESFSFHNNLWFHAENPSWQGPALPVKEMNAVIGKNPVFINASAENFRLQPASPAVGKGYNYFNNF